MDKGIEIGTGIEIEIEIEIGTVFMFAQELY